MRLGQSRQRSFQLRSEEPRRRILPNRAPEVALCDTPERSSVIVKIVGNMIELKKPIASAA
jgi:hypothetical protein